MNDNNAPRLHRRLLSTAVLVAMGISSAQAFEVDTGNPDLSVRFDNTVKLNYGQRVEGRNPSIANSANFNDGDLHFDSGDAINERVDLLTELDVIYQDRMGFRLSGAAWYDHAYSDIGNDDNPYPGLAANAGNLVSASPAGARLIGTEPRTRGLSNFANRYYHGPSGELLDAFLFYNAEIGDSLFNIKIGRHTQYWGETLFNAANGINYGQSALDLGKLFSVPGTEAKELFIPRNQVSASLTLTPELTLGAQYFLEFENSRFPEGGTYRGPYDMALDGGEVFWLPIAAQNAFYGAPRGGDVRPDNSGDFGLRASWSPQWLDGTLGFFYRNTSDTLPFLLVDAPNLHQPGLAGLADLNYFTTYADDIDIFGVSLSKSLGPVSVGMDVNYRRNMALASNFSTVNQVLYDAGKAGLIDGANIIAGKPGSGETGLARGDTFHVVLNGLVAFGDTPLWDASVLAVEGAMTHLVDVTEGEQTFKGHESYRGLDKVTTNAYTLAAKFTPTWYQVLPGFNLSMPMSVSVGLHGNSAVQFGGNEDSGDFSVGLSGDLYQKYQFDLKYVDAFGDIETCKSGTDNNTPGANGAYQCIPGQITSQAGLAPLMKDRGMIVASFKTTF
ncbi:hypothetical protein GCM10011348_30140 [Marinobacterium nitratireducens]|uniref:DUF1302 domain-containing protein n=1 Tax=Marinobacterium nitratireducens TaxID=518897 RepID=A0A918DUY5_9GAMM|nr:DUF1302 domain-containing protein [Marinobacterium nitratireducens]GGO84274.1 hypothetical protein GCM10011348_30140 [Marinobacterium nitratireducens]